MQCIAFATADQYHLPTLSHDLINHGFHEIDLPRGMSEKVIQLCIRLLVMAFMIVVFLFSDASNVLVISTDMAAKADDNAQIFFFR